MNVTARLLPVMVLMLGTSASAFAAQSDFTRVVQTSRLTQGDFTSAVSVEAQSSLESLSSSSEPSTGPGSGTGMYRGVTYRAYAHYGITDWLSVGLEPTFRQQTLSDFSLNALVPELRVRFVDTTRLPVELSGYVDGRIRFQGRRSSTMVAGLGLDRKWSRFAVLLRAGVEKGVGPGLDDSGGRYEAGVSYRVLKPLTIAAEGWGVLEWPVGMAFQSSHHAGLTVKYAFPGCWLASNFSLGDTNQAPAKFLDYTFLFMLGFGG